MKELREKFLNICTGCDGTGEYEEPNEGFENEVAHRTTQCDCENGKELNWDLIYKEQEETKETIKELEVSILVLNRVMRESLDVNNDHVVNAFRQIVKYEKMIEEQEEYIAQLEEIE